jgi:hypothetical protein
MVYNINVELQISQSVKQTINNQTKWSRQEIRTNKART